MQPEPQTTTTNHYGGLRIGVNATATSHKYMLQWDITTLIPVSTYFFNDFFEAVQSA